MITITHTINPNRTSVVRFARDAYFQLQVLFWNLIGQNYQIKKRVRC